MRLSTTVLLLAALCLTGCGTKHWNKPGATTEDFHRDSLECAQQTSYKSRESTGYGFWSGSSDEMKVNKDMYRTCLKARGYLHVYDGQWEGFRD